MGWAGLTGWVELRMLDWANIGLTNFFPSFWGWAESSPCSWAGPEVARHDVHCMNSDREL
jgi:hypothetical protein